MEALTKSIVVGKDQVSPQDQIASAEGQDVQTLAKSTVLGIGKDQVGPQDQKSQCRRTRMCRLWTSLLEWGKELGRSTRPDSQCRGTGYTGSGQIYWTGSDHKTR